MDVIDVELSGTTVRAVDVADNEVEIDAVGWDTPAPRRSLDAIPAAIQASVAGRATELRLPEVNVLVRAIEDEGGIESVADFGRGEEHFELTERRYYLNLTSNLGVFIRFDGAATLRRRGESHTALSFDHPTPVTIGFTSNVNVPEHVVTVPRTPDGVATAISHLDAAIAATGVPAENPSIRRHPPLIEFGDAVDIPPAVREGTHDTGIELVVPDEFAPLFPAAPLAYYLGADVRTGVGEDPVLRAEPVDLVHEFDPLPAFQYQVADLLRWTLNLDVLLRNQVRDTDFVEWDALGSVHLDAERLEAASSAERLARYLELPADALDDALGAWNYKLFVDPEPENARVLPYALDKPPQIYLADADRDRAGGITTGGGGVSRAEDPIGPHLGWLGDEPPPEAFEARIAAHENAVRYARRREAEDRVVVLNDPDRAPVADALPESVSERRSDEVAVDVRRDVDRDDLAALLSTPTDLVHFVGDCTEGLACPDGTLDPGSLESVEVRMVFLDDANSWPLGETFIDAGSVTVVGRRSDRGDGLSADARRTFLDLLAGGFPVNFARRIAGRYAEPPSDLAVLGDGLPRLADNTSQSLGHLHTVEPTGDGRFTVRDFAYMARAGYYWGPDVPEAQACLTGKLTHQTTTPRGVEMLVNRTNDPIVYDDGIHWPEPEELFYPFV